MDTPKSEYGNLGDLIEALQIIGRYGEHGETHCEHDVFTVHGIDPALVSDEDKARLEELGFFVNDEFQNGQEHFTSYRWGSC